MNLCDCGCGETCKRRFCQGHQARGKKVNPKYREGLRTPEYLDSLSKKISNALADPDVKARHASATRAAMSNPETRAALRLRRKVDLPEELILKLYKEGWLLSEIAREIGTGTRPNSTYPRLYYVRKVLVRAGVYPPKATMAAKSGK